VRSRKNEGHRLGLGSFKALGGAYAVIQLLLAEARQTLGRAVDISELHAPAVQAIAHTLTFACATDGNHGRSVAQGAQFVGARAGVFAHASISLASRMSAVSVPTDW
jgi:diaminopropionate ammonia-lyase